MKSPDSPRTDLQRSVVAEFEALGLTQRARNALAAEGIFSVADAKKLTRRELQKLRLVGRRTCGELWRTLHPGVPLDQSGEVVRVSTVR
jgi:DNA-directed RNA polymerase alpha subunit